MTESKSPGKRLMGRIVRLIVPNNAVRGFGFIQTPDGTEYFLHKQNCLPQRCFADLHDGDVVTFNWMTSPKGPKAVDVKQATMEECDAYEASEQQAIDLRAESRGNR